MKYICAHLLFHSFSLFAHWIEVNKQTNQPTNTLTGNLLFIEKETNIMKICRLERKRDKLAVDIISNWKHFVITQNSAIETIAVYQIVVQNTQLTHNKESFDDFFRLNLWLSQLFESIERDQNINVHMSV